MKIDCLTKILCSTLIFRFDKNFAKFRQILVSRLMKISSFLAIGYISTDNWSNGHFYQLVLTFLQENPIEIISTHNEYVNSRG